MNTETTKQTAETASATAANQNATAEKKQEATPAQEQPAKAKKPAPKKATTKKRPATKKTKAAGKKTAAKKTAKKTASKKAASATKAKTATRQTKNPKEETMTKATNKQFEQFTQQTYTGFDEATSFGKDFFDALIQSSNIATSGAQELFKQGMSATQESTEATVAAMKDMMTCRSLNELTEKQGQFAKTTMDKTLSTASEWTEKYVKLCTDCSEPINKKITAAVDKASKKAA